MTRLAELEKFVADMLVLDRERTAADPVRAKDWEAAAERVTQFLGMEARRSYAP